MPDRYALTLSTSFASNTGGPYTATWARAVVPVDGTARGVWTAAQSVTSNARVSTVDIYRQTSNPAAGSNTATSILVSPITIGLDRQAASGSIAQRGVELTAGDVLELRTDIGNVGAKPGFTNLVATVEIERT